MLGMEMEAEVENGRKQREQKTESKAEMFSIWGKGEHSIPH